MKPYEKYKDSGVPWIGEIPEGWEVRKLKYFAKIKNGQDYKKVVVDSGYPVIGSGGQFAFANEFLWDKPSVLLGRKGTVDKPLYIDVPFWTVDTMYYTDINKKSSAKYLYYLATTIHFSYYQYGSAVPSMTQEDLNNIFFATPEDILSQQKIADYLDSKTTSIDSLIADKQKLIELLKEKRQAIISETVTKGLDKTVPMKDSGVPWIGEIPEGWEIKKVSWIFNEINSGTTPKSEKGNYYNGVIPWLNTGDLTDDYIYHISKTVTQEALDNHSVLKIYDSNSLVIAMYGATIGKLGITTIPLCTNQACCVMGYTQSANIKYMFYSFLAIRTYLLSLAYGGGQPNISQSLIRQLRFPSPDSKTQQKIADYLDTQTAKIDTTITDLTTQIEKLKEYRQAIISEVVTGKVMV